MPKQPGKTSRFAAIETLCRLSRTHYPVKPLFDKVAEECGLAGPERGLARNLVYGILRQRQYLDHLLSRLSRHPLKKLDLFVHQALAVGLYQLFCLDRIPESAAVNETVNALKAAKLPKRLQGFVNGILRESIRQRKSLPHPDSALKDGTPPLNHPDWLTERWTDHFGHAEMVRICQSNNLEPQLVLRVNTCRISCAALEKLFNSQSLNCRPGSYAADALVLQDYHGAVTALPGYSEGYFQVQDEAAQLAGLLLAPFPEKGHYLDGCAGLGGKTSHIIQLTMDSAAQVVAVEPEAHRQRLLQENLARLFDTQKVTVHKGSLQDYARICRSRFDGILVDAPCSGTGVTGRHPDIRWNRSAEELLRYQQTQLEILEQAAELATPGGIMVYATCSIEPEENEMVVSAFLKDHPEFQLTDCRPFLPKSARHLTEDRFFRPRPDRTIDGFFAARLQRLPAIEDTK